jgi:hypothetical protein
MRADQAGNDQLARGLRAGQWFGERDQLSDGGVGFRSHEDRALEQNDICPQTGVDEEHRQQQRYDEVVDPAVISSLSRAWRGITMPMTNAAKMNAMLISYRSRLTKYDEVGPTNSFGTNDPVTPGTTFPTDELLSSDSPEPVRGLAGARHGAAAGEPQHESHRRVSRRAGRQPDPHPDDARKPAGRRLGDSSVLTRGSPAGARAPAADPYSPSIEAMRTRWVSFVPE